MRKLLETFMQILFPRRMRCCICGRDAENAVCEACLARLRFIDGRVCLKCGKGIEDEYGDNVCPDCFGKDKHYDLAFSCFQYKEMGKTIIHKLKYEGCKGVAPVLAKLMHHKLKDEGIWADAIVPVPIHKSKEESRGFNQAMLIAEEVAAMGGIPIWDCLIRVKETKDQYKLDKTQRILNVHNAFCIKMLYNNVKYRRILLLDDVYTTGSTADECSRILKQQGIEKVYIITAATGSNT